MNRREYEYMLVAAGQAIHELGCVDVVMNGEPCYHENLLTSAETLEADAAIRVAFEVVGLKVPAEVPSDADTWLW